MKLNVKKWVPRSYVCGSFGILSSVVLLTSCGDKDKGSSGADAPLEFPTRELKVATPEQRAEVLGLLKLVPADAESVFAVYDLPYLVSSIENSNVGRILKSPSFSVDAVEVVDVDNEETDAATLVTVESNNGESWAEQCKVKELIVVSGPGQISFLNAIFSDMGRLNKVLGPYMALGMDMQPDAQQQVMTALMSEIGNLELIKQIDFTPGEGCAPLMVMAELPADMVTEAKMALNQSLGMAGMLTQGMASAHSVKLGSTEYTGLRIDGKLIAKVVEQQLPMATQGMINAKTAKEVADRVAKGSLYIMVAFKDNVVVAAICTNPEKQLALPAKAADSILAKKDFNFADQALDKKASFALYSTPAYMKCMTDGIISYYQAYQSYMKAMVGEMMKQTGADEAIIKQTAADIEVLYQVEIDMMKKYDTSVSASWYGWYDKGLKTEAVCGDIAGYYDWNNPVSYSGICEMPDAICAFAMSMSEDYMNQSMAVVEPASRFVWNMLSAMPKEDGAPFNEECMQKAIELKPALIEIWNASKASIPAYTMQSAFVLDWKGTLPSTLEGKDVPKDYAEKAGKIHIPRVAVVQGLKDRSKLANVWPSIQKTVNEYAPKVTRTDWKLVDPMKEDKDGYTSYFYKLEQLCPAAAKDKTSEAGVAGQVIDHICPAITLNDKLTVWGSSKDYNYEVAKAAKNASSIDPVVYGPLAMYMKVNFAPISKAIDEYAAVSKSKDKQVAEFFQALSKDLKGISATVSKENDRVYTRFNFDAK